MDESVPRHIRETVRELKAFRRHLRVVIAVNAVAVIALVIVLFAARR